ncbi:MAG: OsmC family protein [Anaerolineales bacterium]
MAEKIHFKYADLETSVDGGLDKRGRLALADVPVHYKTVNLYIRIKTDESEKRLARLAELVGRYCPVDSLIGSAVPDYHVTWERMK